MKLRVFFGQAKGADPPPPPPPLAPPLGKEPIPITEK